MLFCSSHIFKLNRKYCRWNSTNIWTTILTFIYKQNALRVVFVCFIVTAENSIWPVVFVFFCSWWTPEDNIYFHRCLSYIKNNIFMEKYAENVHQIVQDPFLI